MDFELLCIYSLQEQTTQNKLIFINTLHLNANNFFGRVFTVFLATKIFSTSNFINDLVTSLWNAYASSNCETGHVLFKSVTIFYYCSNCTLNSKCLIAWVVKVSDQIENMNLKIILLTLLLSWIDSLRTDCNPFRIYR